MSTRDQGVFSRRLRIAGWVCALGIALVIVDGAMVLTLLPADWWEPEQTTHHDGGMHFDLRMMTHMSLWGWIGSWGYLGALAWVPTASIRLLSAHRRGTSSRGTDRVLLATVAVLMLTAVGLVHLTPLRYVSFCHFVL